MKYSILYVSVAVENFYLLGVEIEVKQQRIINMTISQIRNKYCDMNNVTLEQKQKLYKSINFCRIQQHKHKDIGDNVLTEKLQNETINVIDLIYSNSAISNCPYAIHQWNNVMSIKIGERHDYRLYPCLGYSTYVYLSDRHVIYYTIYNINVCQPSFKSGMATMKNNIDDVNNVVSECDRLDDTYMDTDEKGMINRGTKMTKEKIDIAQTDNTTKTHQDKMNSGSIINVEKQKDKVAYIFEEISTETDDINDIKDNDIFCCGTVCYYCEV